MSHCRFALVVLSLAMTGPLLAADSTPAPRPIRMEASRIRQLVQIVQAEPDEQKRRAAVLELGRADPRHSTEVIQAVTQALLKDSSASVRLTAVEALVGYRSVFSYAGLALEKALDSDSSPVVRKAARQALWEYHLMGYKSARSCDPLFPQTPEPPRAAIAHKPAPAMGEPPVRAAAANLPPPVVTQLPAVGEAPGPRVLNLPAGPRELLTTAPPPANLTVEPPLAPIPSNLSMALPGPTMTEPPILPPSPQPLPVVAASPPPFGLYLPPIVADPGPIPGVTPVQYPSPEPPVRKRADR